MIIERFGNHRFLMDKDDGGGAGGSDPEGDEPKGDEPEPTEAEKKLQADLEAKEAEFLALKRDRDGQNKKVGDLQRQIDDLKKAQMSEEQRKEAEAAERAKQDKEERQKFLDQCVSLAVDKSGISKEDSFLLSGTDQDDIFKKGDRLKALLEEAEQAGYDRAKKEAMKGPPPAGGEPGGGDPKPKLGKTTLESLNNLS